MTKNDIVVKGLEIELEKIKMERDEKLHKYKMDELSLRKEIAKLYRPKKKGGGSGKCQS